MATTVAQHSVATFTSPVNGTTPIDANTVRGNDNTTRTAYNDHDADPGIHVQSSSLASRPVAGTAGRKWITEDSGVYTLWFDDGTNWHPVSSENIALTVLAGENLVKGDVVKVTGWNNGQDLPEVVKTTSASDTAFAVITATVSSGSMGYATNTGIVQDVNTAAYSVGTILYANGSGGFTSTKPTSGNYQPVAYVMRSNTNNGVYYVEFSTPRIVERSDNTASTVVLRDASGNFSAGTVSVGALTSAGLVTFASLKGTGATTVTDILNDSTMATASATTLATSASIKTYVDNKVATVDTLAEVLANGNTTGANDIIVNSGQKIRTPAVAAQDGTASITIANSTGALTLNTALTDSNLATISTAGKVANSATTATSANTASAIVARDGSGNFSAGTITATLNGAAPAGSLSGTTLASGVTASSLTSVGTLSSLTVSGNVTVDTDTLFVDAANNRVGIGTTSPTAPLSIITPTSDATVGFNLRAFTTGADGDRTVISRYTSSSDGNWANSRYDAWAHIWYTNGTEKVRLDASGNLAVDTNTLYVDAANNRVGVGTASPGAGYAFDVVGRGRFTNSSSGYAADFVGISSGSLVLYVDQNEANLVGSAALKLSTSGTTKATLDASGNLGLGVTPSAWAVGKALEVGYAGTGINGRDTTNVWFTNNFYWSAFGTATYSASAEAAGYQMFSGAHRWYTAPSGTAGNAISFTQAMTLDASGNLGVGATSPANGVEIAVGSKASAGLLVTGSNSPRIFVTSTGTTVTGGVGADDAAIYLGTTTNHPTVLRSNATERARITSGGYFKASNTGTYSTATDPNHEFRSDGGSNPALYVHNTAATLSGSGARGIFINYTAAPNAADRGFLACWDGNSTTERATIRSNGGLANYQSNNVDLSDARTKTDITPAASMWSKIGALEIVTYKYTDQTHDDVNVGVIAQQVETVEPVWVDADGFGETPADGVPLKTVYTKDITFAAIKALQEAMARIETLEQRVLALEA